MQSERSLAETTAARLLQAIIMSSNSRHEINPPSLHDVNNWLPSVTMAVPSPMNVVMDISVSRIRSSSVATSLILGRRLDDGFRHWKARPTSSFIPSEVKLPPNLGSISSFELKCASIFQCDKKCLSVGAWAVSKRNLLIHKKLHLSFEIVVFSKRRNCSSFLSYCFSLKGYVSTDVEKHNIDRKEILREFMCSCSMVCTSHAK
jgi:hypothetical protein